MTLSTPTLSESGPSIIQKQKFQGSQSGIGTTACITNNY